jgi:trigger factor
VSFTYNKNEDDRRQLTVTVDIDESYMQQEMRKTVRKLSKEVRIPGFRQGKVPYQVMLKRFGEETIRAETIEDMATPIYNQMSEELEEAPYSQVTLQEVTLHPPQLTFLVPLSPVIELGDYRSMRQEVEPIEITEEAIQHALEHVQQQHQILEPVERPAEAGDMVTLGGKGTVPGEIEDDEPLVIFEQERVDILLDAEQLAFGPDFVAEIVGMAAGDEKQFDITLPEDFLEEEHAGKVASFALVVLEVKHRELPDIDDDLAQEEGDYETLDELKEKLTEELETQAARTAREERLDKLIEYLIENSTLVYPEALINEELDQTMERYKRQLTGYGWEWEDYSRSQGVTEESLREEWAENAREGVERGLLLSEFVKAEHIQVADADIEAKFDEQYGHIENEELRENIKEIMMKGDNVLSVANEVILEKVSARLVEIFSGNAPDLEALAAMEDEEE